MKLRQRNIDGVSTCETWKFRENNTCIVHRAICRAVIERRYRCPTIELYHRVKGLCEQAKRKRNTSQICDRSKFKMKTPVHTTRNEHQLYAPVVRYEFVHNKSANKRLLFLVLINFPRQRRNVIIIMCETMKQLLKNSTNKLKTTQFVQVECSKLVLLGVPKHSHLSHIVTKMW